MASESFCELCHDESSATADVDGVVMCEECARHEDYYNSLTPEELTAEQESMSRHVSEQAHE